MIQSMTAYGRARTETAARTVTVEMRAVNSRYFDCSVRLPRTWAALEEQVRAYVKAHATSRGKIEVNISVTDHTVSADTVGIDTAYTDAYVAALRTLCREWSLRDDISVMGVARNPDVFTHTAADTKPEDLWEQLEPTLHEACAGFVAMRQAEGGKIEQDIKEKLENVRTWSERVAEISRTDTVGYRAKLEARLRGLLGDHQIPIDENRLMTECAIWADKIAIDEELTRLAAHFGAFYAICAEAAPSGKKLDFLMQELNRETNTIGSKANNADIAALVVNMKNELEKIREQVQNIE